MREEFGLQHRYDSSIDGELRYSFITDTGIRYIAYFLDMSCYGDVFQNIYTFNFESEHNTRTHYDFKVANTIAFIIDKFFTVNTNSLIFVCDSMDESHMGRHRLFNKWFCKYNDGSLEKSDKVVTTKDYTICTSLITHNANPNKALAIMAFEQQANPSFYTE